MRTLLGVDVRQVNCQGFAAFKFKFAGLGAMLAVCMRLVEPTRITGFSTSFTVLDPEIVRGKFDLINLIRSDQI